MSDKPKTDWERVERDYRAGVLTTREIARRGGITEGAIRKKAKAEAWDRDLAARVQEKVRSELVRSQVRTAQPTPRTEREIVAEAAANTVEVVRGQRRDIAKSIGLVRLAKDAVIKQLDQIDELDMKLAGGLVSLLKDLAIVEKTYIGLERQAFGIRDDSDEGTDTYEDRLHRLFEGVPA